MINKIPAYLQLSYIDACIEQTLLWINGVSVHRNEECCVDFSCCYSELLTTGEKRFEIGKKKLDELFERRKKVMSDGDEQLATN